MPESTTKIEKIEKTDISAPEIAPGGTAIVLQRHERYDRQRDAVRAGSISPEAARGALERDKEFFRALLQQEQADGAPVAILFVSSDTQYAGKGRRSLETTQVARHAAIDALREAGIDPQERIIDFDRSFRFDGDELDSQTVHPMKHLREPDIFATPDYVDYMRDKYGKEVGPGTGMGQGAWAAHEADEEREQRELFGAEGVYDTLDRTKFALRVLDRYASMFHASHPDTRLVIWAGTHYDTISPLVKDAIGTSFTEYVEVDYGAGVVVSIEPRSEELVLGAQSQKVPLRLGKTALHR